MPYALRFVSGLGGAALAAMLLAGGGVSGAQAQSLTERIDQLRRERAQTTAGSADQRVV